jgi:hypothetical protein
MTMLVGVGVGAAPVQPGAANAGAATPVKASTNS